MKIEELELNLKVKIVDHLEQDEYDSIDVHQYEGQSAIVRGAELKNILLEIGGKMILIDVKDLEDLGKK